MKIRIRNLLGVKSADLTLPERGIALIAGLNHAGKSSLLEAVRCAAQGSAVARGISTKKAAAALVHDGAEAGSATLDWTTGSIRVAWPDNEATTKGEQIEIGSPLAIGAVRWMGLKVDERQREFAARCTEAAPTEADIREFLEEREDGDVTLAAALWARVEKDGWDAAHSAAKEKATKLQGAWERLSDQRWGSAKAKVWRPAEVPADETYLPEEVDALVRAKREDVEAIVSKGAVAESEAEALRSTAGWLNKRKAALEEAQAAAWDADAAVEALLQRKPPDPRTERLYECPHCQGSVRLTRNANLAIILVKPPEGEAATEAERLAAEKAYAEWAAAFEAAKAVATTKAGVVAECMAEAQASQKAKDRIKEIQAAAAGGAVPEETVQAARDALAAAEALKAALDKMLAARGIYNDWLACQPLIDALAPDGVRKRAALRGLETLNRELGQISGTGGWALVALDADLNLTLGGRMYGLLSESEQWRADATLMLALAKREGAAFVTLDRLDVLERSCRPGAFRAVLAAGIPALVAVTAPNKLPASDPKGSLPALKQADAGVSYWIEKGVLEELPW